MPLPVAHPLAVLPLRRWCPGRLSFAGLVLGSLTPDLANCVNWDTFTHSLLGSVVFCLPVGAIWLAAFLRVRAALAAALPSPHREALLPLCQRPAPPAVTCVLSLLLGCWTHLVWDLLTHDHSTLARNLGAWGFALPGAGLVSVRVSRLLWLVSSAGGFAALAAVYGCWLRRARPERVISRTDWRQVCRTWYGWVLSPLILAVPLGGWTAGGTGGPAWLARAIGEYYLTLLCVSLLAAGFFFQRRTALR